MEFSSTSFVMPSNLFSARIENENETELTSIFSAAVLSFIFLAGKCSTSRFRRRRKKIRRRINFFFGLTGKNRLVGLLLADWLSVLIGFAWMENADANEGKTRFTVVRD